MGSIVFLCFLTIKELLQLLYGVESHSAPIPYILIETWIHPIIIVSLLLLLFLVYLPTSASVKGSASAGSFALCGKNKVKEE